jgi:hypothetical protein
MQEIWTPSHGAEVAHMWTRVAILQDVAVIEFTLTSVLDLSMQFLKHLTVMVSVLLHDSDSRGKGPWMSLWSCLDSAPADKCLSVC